MKITIAPYNPEWKETFEKLKSDLQVALGGDQIRIDHIGSTSVQGLAAKPIIDILVGINNESLLDKTVHPLLNAGYIYFELYNRYMPYRRLFIKTKHDQAIGRSIRNEDEIDRQNLLMHENRQAHIHIFSKESVHWLRHIAFKEYLIAHDIIRQQYQQLKEMLGQKNWKDGNQYNLAKDEFIKYHEKQALAWFEKPGNKTLRKRARIRK